MKILLYFFAFALPRDMRFEYRDDMIDHALIDSRDRGPLALLAACFDFVSIGVRERLAILVRDIAFAIASARKAPLFAIVVMGTLAVALSTVVTLLAAMTAVFVRPLPFEEPQTLVTLFENSRAYGTDKLHFSYPDAEAVRREARGFEAFGEFENLSDTLTGNGAARALSGGAIDPGYFRVYRWKPALGRFIDDADLRAGAAHVVVISNELWQTSFRGARDVVGRSASIGGTSYRVVGVAPPLVFEANDQRGGITRSDFFVPQLAADWEGTGHNATIVARLAPGVSIARVDLEMSRIFSELARKRPNDPDVIGFARSFEDELLGQTRSVALVVVIVGLSILLIASANVANLFLSRASARTAEIAIRYAIGASRRRIVSQLFTEVALYVVVGIVASTAVAGLLLRYLAFYLTPYPAAIAVRLDPATFVATATVAAFVTIAAGLAPALSLSNPDTSQALKAGGRGAISSTGRRMRAIFAGAEIALALAVCIAAALSVRSVDVLLARPLGFDTANLHLARVAGFGAVAQTDVVRSEMGRIAKRIAAAPGILGAEWSTTTPFGGQPDNTFHIVGSHTSEAGDPHTAFGFVSNGFLAELGVPLIAGREFGDDDRASSPAVAIVNLAFAKAFFKSPENALGKRIVDGYGDPVEATIVGIVGDVRHSRSRGFEPELYLSLAQKMTRNEMLVIRAEPNVAVASIAREAVSGVDPTLVARYVVPYATLMENDIAAYRSVADILTALGAIALVLALAGVYAVVSYGVERRTHEIGIRVALGARPHRIVGMVLAETLRMALPSAAVGTVLGLVAASQLGEVLVEVPRFDPVVYGAVVAALGIAVFVAAFGPAMRAARIVPLVALRYE